MEWRPAQTAVDQSVPTHCKSHTPQVGTREETPIASAILLGPPSVKHQDEGASSRDGNPSNQTTQVVHLGGRLLEDFRKTKQKKRVFIHKSLPASATEV